jgi:hypothetical protein
VWLRSKSDQCGSAILSERTTESSLRPEDWRGTYFAGGPDAYWTAAASILPLLLLPLFLSSHTLMLMPLTGGAIGIIVRAFAPRVCLKWSGIFTQGAFARQEIDWNKVRSLEFIKMGRWHRCFIVKADGKHYVSFWAGRRLQTALLAAISNRKVPVNRLDLEPVLHIRYIPFAWLLLPGLIPFLGLEDVLIRQILLPFLAILLIYFIIEYTTPSINADRPPRFLSDRYLITETMFLKRSDIEAIDQRFSLIISLIVIRPTFKQPIRMFVTARDAARVLRWYQEQDQA